MKDASIGKGIPRVDARLKVTGKADYAAEAPLENMAFAVIVSSSIAKGRVASLDASPAENARGVIAVLTHSNAPRLPGATVKTGPVDRVLQILQDDRIVYDDQPIAVVVADTLERAQHAATLLSARYETQSPTVDVAAEAVRSYAPATAGPHGQTDSHRGGDVDAAVRAARVKVDAVYTTAVQNHNPMECHSTIAAWQGDDRLTLYEATQGIFGARARVAAVFGLPKANVRVVSHYVGGGFGSKGTPWSHMILAAMAAKVARRPVKLMLTRSEMFSLVGHRPKTIQHVTLGADRAGKLLAMKHEVVSETSRFDEFTEPSALQTRMLYACPTVVTTHRLARIDAPTPTFTRAPGYATGTFALESAMDELAYELGMDPVQLRLINHADEDLDEKKPWSSKSLRECYRVGAERFGWSKRPPATRVLRRGSLLVGQGMATAVYPAHQTAASARAAVKSDGRVLVQAGTQDIGTGTYTIMTQIAADTLGVPVEHVRFELGDTILPETPISGGSQTASSTGSAVKRASKELRDKLVTLAINDSRSPLHGLVAGEVESGGGGLFAKADPSKKDTLAAIVMRSGRDEIFADVDNKEKEDRQHFSCYGFGAQFAEVTVDEALGSIRVTRLVGAFAAGKILNPVTARSQLLGGMVWGLGFALLENTVRDPRTGRVTTRDLADYHVAVNADVPAIDVITVPEDDPHVNEIGAKGIGEIGITGVAAALANAVYHATGRRIRDLPITLDKLL